MKFFNKKNKNQKRRTQEMSNNAEYYLSLFAHREMMERANSNSTLEYEDTIDDLVQEIENCKVKNEALVLEIQRLCMQNDLLMETKEVNKLGFKLTYNTQLIKNNIIIRNIIIFYYLFCNYLRNFYDELGIYYFLTKLVIQENIRYKKEFINYYLFGPPPPEPRNRLRALLT